MPSEIHYASILCYQNDEKESIFVNSYTDECGQVHVIFSCVPVRNRQVEFIDIEENV